ncbi:MAG: TIGR00730 family Rossman fold protein [Patescibacteria group bacterium]
MQKDHLNVPASKLPLVEKLPPEKDWRQSFHWRIFRIMAEFVDGWQFLADFKRTVTFFGSARCKEGDKWYKEARQLGNLLAKDGFSVITGGGPGIMEAANRGAHEAKEEAKESEKKKIGDSIGLNIKLYFEQRINAFVDKSVAFHYFFVRKVMLSYYAQAYVYFPGGFGTLDEAFELINLVEVKKVRPVPIILIGKDYWEPLEKWIKESVYEKYEAIDKEDMEIYKIVDSAEEAYEIIKKAPERKEF